ncbi:unnamed protein product [Owenia fusiformis]|uniref:Uncharacterized protein n=1 Tax=Owenia fusiformis TaxID=6347 RepID=A0A8J1XIB9_OWEFU|nr:unnamed protein product [Owenia fusiformis]
MPPKRKAGTDGRFKTIKVTAKTPIKDLVASKKLVFEKGRGFYQLTKPEIIQDNKEIVARRKSDGSFISGDTVRSALSIPADAAVKKFKLDLSKLPDFDVFIQSTSYNRALMPNTEFLYDVGGPDTSATGDDAEDEPPVKKTKGKAAAPKATKKAAAPKTAAPKGRGRGKKAAEEPTAEAADDEDEETSPSSPTKPKSTVPPPGAGGPIEIVFTFDTTGSMYPALGQVRSNVQNMIKRLNKEIPGIRIAIIAHGDYQDKGHPYCTCHLDFTGDEKKLCNFVKTVKSTCGYDADECYELVLHEARTELSWTPGTQRSLVMIGDCNPHEPNYGLNKKKLDWRKEAKALGEMGVRIYGCQALNYGAATNFYRTIAKLTGGYHLNLDQFAAIQDFMMAICFNERGMDQLQAYEAEVKGRKKGGGMNRELHRLFDTLNGRTKSTFVAGDVDGDLTAVNPSRFQILHVDEKCAIKQFVQDNDLVFKAGQGFYEFTKPELISHKKEVVLVDKATGDMFTGPEACALIGAGGSSKIKPAALEKWRVFVQSTSYNRVLMPDTGFLYEVDPDK